MYLQDSCRSNESLAFCLLQGITGIRFSGGEKCYIKTQVKARLSNVEALNKDSLTFDLVCGPHCQTLPSPLQPIWDLKGIVSHFGNFFFFVEHIFHNMFYDNNPVT